jgi:hypothetical protein
MMYAKIIPTSIATFEMRGEPKHATTITRAIVIADCQGASGVALELLNPMDDRFNPIAMTMDPETRGGISLFMGLEPNIMTRMAMNEYINPTTTIPPIIC